MTLIILGFFDEKIPFAAIKQADPHGMNFEHGYPIWGVFIFEGIFLIFYPPEAVAGCLPWLIIFFPLLSHNGADVV